LTHREESERGYELKGIEDMEEGEYVIMNKILAAGQASHILTPTTTI